MCVAIHSVLVVIGVQIVVVLVEFAPLLVSTVLLARKREGQLNLTFVKLFEIVHGSLGTIREKMLHTNILTFRQESYLLDLKVSKYHKSNEPILRTRYLSFECFH